MRVLILHDGLPADARPDELDTLVQVEAVHAALEQRGWDVVRLAWGTDLSVMARRIRALEADAAFNLVESVLGVGRLTHVVPSVLEWLGLPLTGAGSRAMAESTSKLATKRVLERAALPTPDWRTVEALRAGCDLPLGRRWLAKAVWEHGSLGLEPESVVRTDRPEVLAERVESLAARVGDEAFAEEYVHGREFNVALLDGADGPRVLPIPEILFHGLDADEPRVVGYRAKWDPDSPDWSQTPRSFPEGVEDGPLLLQLRELAAATWRAFELSGWARVDMRVGSDGRARVIDVNANPCLSPDAGFAATLERANVDYADAIEGIVQAALTRNREPQHVPHSTDRR